MSARQLAWRVLYEVLAARVRRPERAFMDHGSTRPRAGETRYACARPAKAPVQRAGTATALA